MKILLVDDDATITALATYKLQLAGHNITSVNGGWQALNLLRDENYDLLITDLIMPDISGLTVLSLLKNFLYGKIPVIIISSLDQPAAILNGIGLGANDFFTKPIDFEKLLLRIDSLANKSKAS